jgi:hypothetical protein
MPQQQEQRENPAVSMLAPDYEAYRKASGSSAKGSSKWQRASDNV